MTSLRVALKLSMADAKPEKPTKKRSSSLGAAFEEDALPPVIRKRKLSLGDMKDRKSGQDEGQSEDTNNDRGSVDDKLSYRNKQSGSEDTLATPVNQEPEKDEILSGDALLPVGLPEEDEETGKEESENIRMKAEDEREPNEDDAPETPVRKPKKKRNSLRNQLLENAGLLEESGAVDPDTGRYQSHRAAAALAKTKLMTSTPRTSSNKETSAEEGTSEKEPTIASGRGSKKSQASLASLAGGAATPIAAVAVVEENVEWVQCDKCSKWRSVAPHVDASTLAEVWFCHMNTWDPRFDNCAAPEVVTTTADDAAGAVDAALATAAAAPVTASGRKGGRGGGGGGRWKNRSSGGREQRERAAATAAALAAAAGGGGGDPAAEGEGAGAMEEGSDREEQEEAQPLARRKPTRSSAATAAYDGSSGGGGAAPQVNWVQCNKCKKWRKVPETVNMDDLPDRWYCSLNVWNPAYSRCAAKEETDTTTAVAGYDDELTGGGGGGGGRSAAARRRSAGSGGAAGFGSPLPQSSNTPALPAIKKVNWVQCERKNCRKWRKVPAHIDTASFPEKWFCEMNNWDPDTASCDAPELSDSEDDHQAAANTATQLILSNSKGPGALSYRRIIFGTDGKIRPCFSDRNRNGYGIFSSSEQRPSNDADDYTEPIRRLSYWWSSVYDETGVTYVQKGGKKAAAAAAASVAAASSSASLMDMDDPTDGSAGVVGAAAATVPKKIEQTMSQQKPSYLLDTIARLTSDASQPCGDGFHRPKAIPKADRTLHSLTLFQRMAAEKHAVRSCFLLDGTNSLTFPRMQALLANARFPDAALEAVRQHITVDSLKVTLRAMENDGLLLVSISNVGVLSFELLKMPLPESKEKESEHILPLKLRLKKGHEGSAGAGSILGDAVLMKEEGEMSHHPFKKYQKWLNSEVGEQ